MSTKAALRPSSRLRTLPLKMLPTRRSSVVRSMVNSSRRPSSETATRVSRVSALMMTSLWIFLTGLMRRWTFLTSVLAAARMVSTRPLGCSFTGTGSKGFSSSTSAGVSRLGSRKSRLPGVWRRRFLGQAARAAGRRRCFRRARFRARGGCSIDAFRARGGRRWPRRGPAGRRGRVGVVHGPARRWGGSACRAAAGRNFCHS